MPSAVILAAGKGTRLGRLTESLPKPLLQLNGEAVLEANLRLIASAGVTEVAINLHHHGALIRHLIGDGTRFGITVLYSEEASLLGTAGGVSKARRLLSASSPLIVIYGDNLMRLSLEPMLIWHSKQRAAATIGVHRVNDCRNSGLILFDKNSRVLQFLEKPGGRTAVPGWVNAGVYLLEPPLLELIPAGVPSDFAFDVFPDALARGLRLSAYPLKGADRIYPIDTVALYAESKQRLAESSARRRVRNGQRNP